MAHPVPADVRETLHDRIAPLRARHQDVRWTRPEGWHLTLLFLGVVRPYQVSELATLVDAYADSHRPFEVGIDGAGGRARGRYGVAWLSIALGAGDVIEGARWLAERIPPQASMGPSPKRTPSAHLTVARKADAAVIEALEMAAPELTIGWTVRDIRLMRSHLGPDGARYETLHECTL